MSKLSETFSMRFRTALSVALQILGMISICTCGLIILWQGYHWLQAGKWASVTLADWKYFYNIIQETRIGVLIQTPWRLEGLRKVFVWLIFDVPLSLYFFVLGWILITFSRKLEPRLL